MEISFSETLHRSWFSAKVEGVNEERIEAAKAAAGIREEVNIWVGWQKLGYEVIYGSRYIYFSIKCSCCNNKISKGTGNRIRSFYQYS